MTDGKTYSQEELNSAIKDAVASANYQGTIESRLANLEKMTKEANNLKSEIIDLIHEVDNAQRVRIQQLLDTLERHTMKPGHPQAIERLDDLEDGLAKFGYQGIGDDDAAMLKSVLVGAAEGERRLNKVERKSTLIAMNSNRVIATTAAIGVILSIVALVHQLWH